MKKKTKGYKMHWSDQARSFLHACLVVLLAWGFSDTVQGQDTLQLASEGIPLKKIAALQEELGEVSQARSSTRKRRACKAVIREGEAILRASPSAPNRFRVLAIVLETKKKLLGLENSEGNREALFKTCEDLVRAPDDYAEFRLEADLLLSERDLALEDADTEKRAGVLSLIVDRYRSTPAEAKSLMMAARIAPKLQAFDLQKRVLDALGERFAGDMEVIEFRRKHLGLGRMEVLFKGVFMRSDGVTLRFPADLMGRQSLMVFWSQKTPGFEDYLKMIKEQEGQFPGQFEVFSFNVDELPDAGESTLKSMGFTWTVMRLPGGKKSQTYRSYVVSDPVGVFVNAYGYALLVPNLLNAAEQAKLGVRGAPLVMSTLNRRLDNARFLSQLQALLIGDVLVTEPEARTVRTAETVPIETLHAIKECFTPAPFRYRLSATEALANYERAAKLCGEAAGRHPGAPDLWMVRNRRIIALLGMWNLAGEPRYLEKAVREAQASLAIKLPPGADIVPRFCLAREALRLGDLKSESVIQDLLKKTGGAEAPSLAYAAATILALNANSRDLHERYCAPLLAAPGGGDPALWSMVSFLRDRVYTYRLLKANHIKNERESARDYMINHGTAPMRDVLPTMTLKTLDGRTLTLPQDTKGKLTLLVFVEPSTEPDAEFPVDLGEGEDKKPHHHYLQFACDLQDKHLNKDLTTIVASLSEDAEHLHALMKSRGLTCQAAIVPGGLANPIVRRLGVLSADRIPNAFLVRRDGSIAWRASGLPYGDAEKFVNLLAAKVHIESCEVETAYEALNRSDFEEAARIFGGPYLPWDPDRFGWRPPRYHGKALAYMAMKDWKAALESVEVAIEAQNLKYLPGRKRERAPNWRKDAAKVTVTNPDEILIELWTTKAEILAKLGRNDEAAQIRERYTKPTTEFPPGVYKSFHEKLKEWKTRNQIDKP
jgi:tetratricopeptide (TPR) repeat protein